MQQPQQAPQLQLIGPVPPELCPQALPSVFSWNVISLGNGEKHVIIQAATPAGVAFYVIPAEIAEALGTGLLSCARQARSGIMVMPPGLMP